MSSGRFRDLVIFQKRNVQVVSEIARITWPEAFPDWADVERSSETVARFAIHYRRTPEGNEITPDSHRLIWESIIWNITSAIHDRKRRIILIDCDFSEAIEVTHFQSLVREYIDAFPVLRPRQ